MDEGINSAPGVVVGVLLILAAVMWFSPGARHKFRKATLWLVIVAVKPLLNAVDLVTLGWMLAGGLFYTLGTFFYHRESIRYSHAIWHLFVIAGSVCHFVAVTQQILTPRLAS